MITKNTSKNTYYIERDTIAKDVMSKIYLQLEKELLPIIENEINELKSKDAGTYRTLDVVAKIGNTEMSRLIRYYKSAVITGYYRQHYGNWERKIKAIELQQADSEIKKLIGFVERGSDGMKTNIPNSITNFNLVKEFLQFLTDVENVCFVDNGYLFPDAEEYKKIEKTKGKDIAKKEYLSKLHEHMKNMHANREII